MLVETRVYKDDCNATRPCRESTRQGPNLDADLNLDLGRKITDLMPIKPSQLKVNKRWTKLLRQREAVMAKRHITCVKGLNNHTREVKPINMGHAVSIQNGHGNKPLRWDNTGTTMEVAAFNKYVMKEDSSGRLTQNS